MSTIAINNQLKAILRGMGAANYEDAIKILLIETNRLNEEKPKTMWISASVNPTPPKFDIDPKEE